MKTLLVGAHFASPDITPINFLSQKYLLDYDLIIVELNALALQIHDTLKLSTGYAYTPTNDIVKKRINERVVEIKDFFAHSGNICVVVDRFPIFEYNLKNTNGTPGGNTSIDLLRIFLPQESPITYTALTGDISEYDPLLSKLAETCTFSYHALMDHFDGSPLLWTKKAKKVIGFASKNAKGIFISLPGFRFKDTMAGPVLKKTVFDDIIELINGIKYAESTEHIIEPDWVKDIVIGHEESELDEMNQLIAQNESLQRLIEGKKEKIKHYSTVKSVLYLESTPLEFQVKSLFEKMDFAVEKPSGYDVDLILRDGDFVAVIETKGIKSSGAKSHSRQLENWVTNYGMTNADEAKGILIINAFKNIPLDQRTELAFPPDMVSYSTQRGHCLMLTKDLMNIYIDFENGLISKNEIVKLLNECIGVLEYAPRFALP